MEEFNDSDWEKAMKEQESTRTRLKSELLLLPF